MNDIGCVVLCDLSISFDLQFLLFSSIVSPDSRDYFDTYFIVCYSLK